ncbi:hypothetical protein QIL54_gp2 [ssRNA phage Esthiorhiza.2_6]|uniref:Uncharacterized protein n=2 Tax=Fiersviridae TaxID=2842319 RepID=A0A8S5L3D8_9VIRU|nr:hypothetical protein QIL54_gp2 [ssRNA phage Esthiorhiza.2_6]QDH90509.1 MAG: hypothetical protein H2RhizoLitter491109_000004 [Leviviridae sp.]DAD51940.1 TPA_asm: hypothetical protein [ssRNA phage Esthiorhiza.2_6]
MKTTTVPVDRRSQRAEKFRKVADFYKSRTRVYKIGFLSVLSMLILSEIDFDLSEPLGKRVKFHLNPSHETLNQEKSCK